MWWYNARLCIVLPFVIITNGKTLHSLVVLSCLDICFNAGVMYCCTCFIWMAFFVWFYSRRLLLEDCEYIRMGKWIENYVLTLTPIDYLPLAMKLCLLRNRSHFRECESKFGYLWPSEWTCWIIFFGAKCVTDAFVTGTYHGIWWHSGFIPP